MFAWLLLMCHPAMAHLMRGSAIHVTAKLTAEADRFDIDYEVYFAKLAALNEKQRMDIDKDGTLSADEQRQYLERVSEGLARSIILTCDGKAMMPEIARREMALGDVRVVPMKATLQLHFVVPFQSLDDNIHHLFFVHRGEWGQTAGYVTGASGGVGIEIFENAQLRRLAAFEVDPLSSKYPDRSVDVLFRSTSGPPLTKLVARLTSGLKESENSAQDASILQETQEVPDRSEGLLNIIRGGQLNSSLITWAVLTALFLGGAHALEPGHGKTIVAAYLVGNRGHIRHALALGVIVTVTHTIGVIILGLLVLYAYDYILPDRIVTWLGVMSGLLIVSIGCYLFSKNTPHHGHSHEHHTHHEHGSHGHTHSHLPQEITLGSLLSLGISGGLVPCPGALVILLTAMTLNRLILGLVLLACFSLGLAIVLIAIGILMVVARPFMDRWSGQGRLLQSLPRISAALIICLGFAMAVQALITGGIITINL
jgi:nickel/cobalt exporter